MDIAWNDLWAALALVLVIEGIIPFLSPGQARITYLKAASLRDPSLRTIGLISMLLGLALLYVVR